MAGNQPDGPAKPAGSDTSAKPDEPDLEAAHGQVRRLMAEVENSRFSLDAANRLQAATRRQNDRLFAHNVQLHQDLDDKQSEGADLRTMLSSTKAAILLLDTSLRVRAVSPGLQSLFGFMPADLGRPLADIASLGGDRTLVADAAQALHDDRPGNCTVNIKTGLRLNRRIAVDRSPGRRAGGVIVTFSVRARRRRGDAAATESGQHAAAFADDTLHALAGRLVALIDESIIDHRAAAPREPDDNVLNPLSGCFAVPAVPGVSDTSNALAEPSPAEPGCSFHAAAGSGGHAAADPGYQASFREGIRLGLKRENAALPRRRFNRSPA